MSDYISRQAAIEAICKVCSIVGDYHKCDGYPETSTWCEEITALRAILSADVQPVRHGNWVFGNTLGHSWMKCSECLVSQNGQTATYTYCPNCGARMDGEQNETD